MHGRNRNVCMDSDLRSWPWVNQRIPDHKPSALFSSSRLPQPYGHLEFRKMRQRRRNSTHYMPPLKVRGGAYIKFYTESRNGIKATICKPLLRLVCCVSGFYTNTLSNR